MVVIMIGRKRKSAARRMASCAGKAAIALGDDGEVDEHNAVLFHDANEQDDADQCNQAEIEMEQHQRCECADAGRR